MVFHNSAVSSETAPKSQIFEILETEDGYKHVIVINLPLQISNYNKKCLSSAYSHIKSLRVGKKA